MKARAKPETTIGEGPDRTSYRLTLWPTSEAFDWQYRLARLGLESAASAISASGREWSDLEEADFASVAQTVLRSVEREGLSEFIKGILGKVEVLEENDEGKEVAVLLVGKGGGYEVRYAGRTMHLYRLVGWVIRENFSDFIPAVDWIAGVLDSLKSSGSSDDSESSTADETEAETATT